MLTIKSIKPVGNIRSYDIVNHERCFGGEGNFFIDGVLVHNSTLRNGVKSFHDLTAMSALGHPGPLQMIPEYVKRRDDPNKEWLSREIPEIAKLLESTHGIVVYQEQFTSLLQRIAGFTGPEAQDARKSVAKKWVEKLKPVRQKWIVGAQKFMSESKAIEWYDDILLPFGRYCFNYSHALAYCLWAYRCLWLKAHFPEEWWASVMGLCDQKALERYMAAARGEGVVFGEIDIARLTSRPTAHSGATAKGIKQVALGLTSLKKVGDNMAVAFIDETGGNTYSDIDDFVSRKGKSKIICERLIKLGAFIKLHPNVRATWMWYLHEYCSGSVEEFEFDGVDDQAKVEIARSKQQQLQKKPKLKSFSFPIKILKDYHLRQLLANDNWTEEAIETERARQIAAYKSLYPKRNKILPKILKWRPDPKATRDRIMALHTTDYELRQILNFEKEFLGYYWHSPCDLYQVSGHHTIDMAKKNDRLEGVIIDISQTKTKKGSDMLRMTISDGRKECLVLVWEQNIKLQKKKLLQKDQGIRLRTDYDPDRNSFVLKRGTIIEPLWSKSAWDNLRLEAE